MSDKKHSEVRPEAKAYVDSVLETMRTFGAQPNLPKETYNQTVQQVSNAFRGLRPRKG